MFVHANPNPKASYVIDCVVRAIALATGHSWDYIYIMVCIQGFIDKNMPSANAVWENYIYANGFRPYAIPNQCPRCYTIRDFCWDNPYGTYILATGTHVIAVIDGNYYDSWDSGDEVPISVWRQEKWLG